MTDTLLDLARRHLTPDVVDRLASYTGESPAATTKAIGGAVPAVLAGLLQNAAAPGGLGQLVNMFTQNPGQYGGSMLDNLGGALAGGGMDSLVKSAGPLLGSLFGARSGGLGDLLASYAGVKKSSAMSLLGLAAPFVMNLVGKSLASRGGVNANSLRDLLVSQRGSLAAAAPPGLAGALGLGDLSSLGANLASQVGQSANAAAAEAKGGLSKLLPLLVGIAALLLLFSFMRGCGKPSAGGTAVDTVGTAAPAASPSGTTTTGPAYGTTGTTTTGPAAGGAGTAAPAVDTVTPGTVGAPSGGATGAPAPAPAPDAGTGAGAMGGQGKSGTTN